MGHHHQFFDFSDRSNAERVSGDLEIHRESSRGIDIDRHRHQDIDRQSQKNIDQRSHTKGGIRYKIENTTATMKYKWRRGDEAMRDFTGTWFNKSRDEMKTCFPANPSRQLPRISTDETLPISIDKTSPAATDDNMFTSIDIYSGLEPELTSNLTELNFACLGAWYTWDRILQTSLEEESSYETASQKRFRYSVIRHPDISASITVEKEPVDSSATAEKKAAEPELAFEILVNPARVVPAQEKYIKLLEDSRYVPVKLAPSGFVLLKDLREHEPEKSELTIKQDQWSTFKGNESKTPLPIETTHNKIIVLILLKQKSNHQKIKFCFSRVALEESSYETASQKRFRYSVIRHPDISASITVEKEPVDSSATAEKKAAEPELAFEILVNPARVVPAQEKYIKLLEDSRYVPVKLAPSGFVLLKDLREHEPEVLSLTDAPTS
ncbi:hypothetical protein F2Q69_00005749 [Brassica cretica]|uniref:26S proteasome regulatory subunit RPN2 C-terminal domain-containing protein n=1 Tax=Brassica cretica TaxID=69181 RepID=A0A8S9P3X2_BRACR|nr:hypothetical protein F2Q69_00005749 [Brassica cretica]